MKRILFIISALLVSAWVLAMILMATASLFMHVLLIGGLFLALHAIIMTPAERRVDVVKH